MNLEVDIILRFFKLRDLDELFILTGSKDDEQDEGDEWQGFIQKMRGYQQEETSKIDKKLQKMEHKIDGRISRVERKMDHMIDLIKRKI